LLGGRSILYSFCGVLGSNSSGACSQLSSPLALALLLEPLLLHTTLILLLFLEELQGSLKLLLGSFCSSFSLLLLLFFNLTCLGLTDLARQPESSTTIVQILTLQVEAFAAILALLFVFKSLS
jgi:hypothetical protein